LNNPKRIKARHVKENSSWQRAGSARLTGSEASKSFSSQHGVSTVHISFWRFATLKYNWISETSQHL